MTAVALGLLGLATVFLAFVDFRKALLLFTVLLPFSGFLPALELKGLNLQTIMVAALYYAAYRRTGRLLPSSPLSTVLVVLVCVALVSWLTTSLFPPPPRLNYVEDAYWLSMTQLIELKRWVIFLPIYFIYVNGIRSRNLAREVMAAVVFGVGLESLHVFKEYVVTGRARVYGSLSNPNELGAFAAAYLPLAAVYLYAARGVFQKFYYSGIGGLTLFSLIFSQSRGGYLSFLMSIGLFGFLRSKVLFVGIILGGIVAFTVSYRWLPDVVVKRVDFTFSKQAPEQGAWGEPDAALADRLEGSADSRLILAKTALVIFANYPIFGSGFGTFEYIMGRYVVDASFDKQVVAHNMYMQVLSELGLVGFIPFMAIFVISLRQSYTLYRTGQEGFARNVSLAFVCCVLAFMVANLFGNRFYRIALTGYYWALAAVVFAFLRWEREERGARADAAPAGATERIGDRGPARVGSVR